MREQLVPLETYEDNAGVQALMAFIMVSIDHDVTIHVGKIPEGSYVLPIHATVKLFFRCSETISVYTNMLKAMALVSLSKKCSCAR